ncbi:AAA family ATPase [Mesorhizobium sp. M0664]|uniref:AAA family ATPase n=1 Tax=Mesorhizobium sp. M0664 TaxID=2956982 RepID=UPI0033377DA9
MKEAEYRNWLHARRWRGNPLTEKAINVRIARLRRVERSLKDLGFDTDNVDAIFERGNFPALLKKLADAIGSSEKPPEKLVPEAENPDGQLNNLLAVTRLYGKFASGEDPNAHDLADADIGDESDDVGTNADTIRAAALTYYIEPARKRGDERVSIRAGDLHNRLGLEQAHANVCQALGGAKFQRLAQVPPPTAEGPPQSSTTTFHYQLSQPLSTHQANAVPVETNPTNLIFFGPPGTGKTYRTTHEAVRLCDGSAPADRAALKERYRELERQQRIGFVTFHQSFSYEDFVEGLRPETNPSAGSASSGFRLEVNKGAFCKIAALADQARTAAGGSQQAGGYDLADRRFWKMGLGTIGAEDHIYEQAIAGDYIVLGWGGDVDWSDAAYNDLAAVRAKWAEVAPADSKPSNISQLWPFRTEMKKGDIIIVPYGNSAFRAVGEVIGDYSYEPSDEGGYNHRRAVNWLLILDKPLPLDSIIEGTFTMRTLYPINRRRIKIEALSRLLGGDGNAISRSQAPQPFVLIIDEINRANISKVFGELITLLEPDKRLGMENEITVKLPYSGDPFGVPLNLHIVATMNTADRSIALLDTALRRRFTFRELMPDPVLLAEAARKTQVDLVAVLTVINARIEYLFDREHQIGHAFFMGCQTRDDVDDVMRDRVLPLLQEYFFEDWSRLAMVLGEYEGVKDGAFLRCEKIAPPPGFNGDDRWRWSVRGKFAPDAYQRLIGRVQPANDRLADPEESSAAE